MMPVPRGQEKRLVFFTESRREELRTFYTWIAVEGRSFMFVVFAVF
jgi:hypothetical protein